MLIYDRRRCRPPREEDTRRRLTLTQRARLGQLEHEGWRLLFVRGEPSSAFLTHDVNGHAMLARDGRLIAVRSLPLRQDDASPALDEIEAQSEITAEPQAAD